MKLKCIIDVVTRYTKEGAEGILLDVQLQTISVGIVAVQVPKQTGRKIVVVPMEFITIIEDFDNPFLVDSRPYYTTITGPTMSGSGFTSGFGTTALGTTTTSATAGGAVTVNLSGPGVTGYRGTFTETSRLAEEESYAIAKKEYMEIIRREKKEAQEAIEKSKKEAESELKGKLKEKEKDLELAMKKAKEYITKGITF